MARPARVTTKTKLICPSPAQPVDAYMNETVESTKGVSRVGGLLELKNELGELLLSLLLEEMDINLVLSMRTRKEKIPSSQFL